MCIFNQLGNYQVKDMNVYIELVSTISSFIRNGEISEARGMGKLVRLEGDLTGLN
jgi:hypothetical protein